MGRFDPHDTGLIGQQGVRTVSWILSPLVVHGLSDVHAPEARLDSFIVVELEIRRSKSWGARSAMRTHIGVSLCGFIIARAGASLVRGLQLKESSRTVAFTLNATILS